MIFSTLSARQQKRCGLWLPVYWTRQLQSGYYHGNQREIRGNGDGDSIYGNTVVMGTLYMVHARTHARTRTHTHLTALFPGLPGWAGTRKVKPIWISLKQETVSGSGISWAICKSVPRSRQMTTPAPHHSVFYRPDALPATQPTASKH